MVEAAGRTARKRNEKATDDAAHTVECARSSRERTCVQNYNIRARVRRLHSRRPVRLVRAYVRICVRSACVYVYTDARACARRRIRNVEKKKMGKKKKNNNINGGPVQWDQRAGIRCDRSAANGNRAAMAAARVRARPLPAPSVPVKINTTGHHRGHAAAAAVRGVAPAVQPTFCKEGGWRGRGGLLSRRSMINGVRAKTPGKIRARGLYRRAFGGTG